MGSLVKSFFKSLTEKEIYEKGKKLFLDKQIIYYEEKKELEDVYSIEAKIRDQGKVCLVEVFVNLRFEYLSNYNCSCYFYSSCSHVMAVILHFLDKHGINMESDNFQKYDYEIIDGELKTDHESTISNWINSYYDYNDSVLKIMDDIGYEERKLIYLLKEKGNYNIDHKLLSILNSGLKYKENDFKIIEPEYYFELINEEIIKIENLSKLKKEKGFHIEDEKVLNLNDEMISANIVFELIPEYIEKYNIKLSEDYEKFILYEKTTEYSLRFKNIDNKLYLIPTILLDNIKYENHNILNISKEYETVDEKKWMRINIKEYQEFIDFFESSNLEYQLGKGFWVKRVFFEKDYFSINKKWKKLGLKEDEIEADLKLELENGKKIKLKYILNGEKLNAKEIRYARKTGLVYRNNEYYYLKNRDVLNYDEEYTGKAAEIMCNYNSIKESFKLSNKDYLFKNINLNKTVSKKLRNYQIDGVRWLKFLQMQNFSGILADDMGLGKTVQTISLIEETGLDLKYLILSPKSLIYNWKDEFDKFLGKGNYKLVYDGDVKKREKLLLEIDRYQIVIASYSVIKKDYEKLLDTEFDYIIIDEAQSIKNSNTLLWKAVTKLNSKHRLALSGTPLENDIKELWSIFEFLMPGYLGSKEQYTGIEGIKLIKHKTAPFVLRRNKKEVLKELPEKTEKIIRLNLHPEQQKIYDDTFEQAKQKVHESIKENGIRKAYFTILSVLTYLREICDHPKLIGSSVNESAKLDLFEELVEEAIENGHKILVFSQFVKMLALLEESLKQKKIKYEMLTGETKNRIEKVKKFNRSKSIKVFLISLKAGGVGLNLTSADTVIHIDPWWNPMVENQATDRVHRIGQTRNINVYKIIAKNTIEEKILEIQKKKKEIFQAVIEDNKNIIEKVSVEELGKIFE